MKRRASITTDYAKMGGAGGVQLSSMILRTVSKTLDSNRRIYLAPNV